MIAIRGLLAFLVRYGFTLSDVRNLYLDELLDYYAELVKTLEAEGVMKQGTSAKISGRDDSANELRNELRKLGK